MFKGRTLWTAVIMAALMFLYVEKVGAACIVPMSPFAADPRDVMYIVRGADGVYRFTIQNSNTTNPGDGSVCDAAANCATTFGVGSSTSAAPLGGNPFATGVTDTNGNGFADTLGSSSGFTNTAPYTTLPGGSGGNSDPECHSFCSTTAALATNTDAATSVDPDALAVGAGGCATEILVRGDDTNIYRTAFKERFVAAGGAGARYGDFDVSLGALDSATTFPGDGSASGEDGFPGVHGTTVPWSKISP